MSSLEETQHLKIPFGEIVSATNEFETSIGKGGFGGVYRGQLAISGRVVTVAVKRLNSEISGQGSKEFLMEIQLLSRVKHRNIIPLVGFCDERKEKILIYEYAENGSLDTYLTGACSLTWTQRLRICVGVAHGLDHLHNQIAKHYRVIHRDIKSANILLDGNWEAKISDLGLSRIGVTNENNSFMISNACGTPGYCDPEYIVTGILTKESDVYSFGMVLFEVLCGRLCLQSSSEGKFLGSVVKKLYESNALADFIDPILRKKTSSDSLNVFSAIAYKCLRKERRQRPSMSLVLKRLEKALELQEKYEISKTDDTGELVLGIFFDAATKMDPKTTKPEGPPIDGQKENIDSLIRCVSKNIGFSNGKPVAAFTIYKCLLHWNSFGSTDSTVLDRVTHMISSAFQNDHNLDNIAYWLSNASTLLILTQTCLNPSTSPPTSLFRRLATAFPWPWAHENPTTDVQAKPPAFIFMRNLTTYVQDMYKIVRDALNEEVKELLALCIQAPRITFENSSFNHWKSVTGCLENHLRILKENRVPSEIIQAVFTQAYSCINVHLFNSILLRPQRCTFRNAQYKPGLQELEQWCTMAEDYAGSSWDQLNHIRQAVGFLVTHEKHKLSVDEIVKDICPILSVQQLYAICTMYWDYDNTYVSPSVISSLRVLMKEESAGNLLLIEDVSVVPFSVDDLCRSSHVKDFEHVKPARELLENPFGFLLD